MPVLYVLRSGFLPFPRRKVSALNVPFGLFHAVIYGSRAPETPRKLARFVPNRIKNHDF